MPIQSLDFHYHAGQERLDGISLRDHLNHAVMTGRRVLGVTDHLQYFWPRTTSGQSQREQRFPYPTSLAGLSQYREEVESSKADFPQLKILFAPEVPPKTRLRDIPDEVLAISDYFICEQTFKGDESATEENTCLTIARLQEISDFTKATGKPAFFAHPFRLSINNRLVKHEIKPWVTAIQPRGDGLFSPEELARYFLLDLEQIATAAATLNAPLEVNGQSEERVRASNLPAALQMLRCAYRLFRKAGVQMVPGSDQHGFIEGIGRKGCYVPYETFEVLGMTALDIQFARGLWGSHFDSLADSHK